MTEKETKMILAILRQNYKNAKIEDPQAEVQLWLNNFGKYPVQIVRIAVEWHMKDSEFWPTTAAMNKLLPRAEVYAEWLKNNEKPANALEAPAQAKVTAIPDGMSEDEFIDKFIEAQIEWEKEMWGDDDPIGLNRRPCDRDRGGTGQTEQRGERVFFTKYVSGGEEE